VVFEKKSFPFHRVCGEYISNETVPFLKSIGLFPQEFNPPQIHQLQLTSVNGKSATLPLDLGGFGISRYAFDYFLYQKAKEKGVIFYLDTEVDRIIFNDNRFEVSANQTIHTSDVVIGSFGKRSRLDVAMTRTFIKKRSPYVGVKYHIKTEHQHDLIALHNFKDGYCGISNIEDGKTTLCYLTHRDNLKSSGNIKEMEESILFRNPFIKQIFLNSEFLFERPETINEISFETKAPVENHILMCGDSAGMITPLCGNGMAMAIHSSKVASNLVQAFCEDKIDRAQLESQYKNQWEALFASRLNAGRLIQNLFGSEWASNVAVNLARHTKPVANYLISKTHGQAF
jgi:Dehydrogenases (flavoproteins)